eukprot:SAG31_NODE_15781_length_739_cov_1.012500_1_plen_89_part_10
MLSPCDATETESLHVREAEEVQQHPSPPVDTCTDPDFPARHDSVTSAVHAQAAAKLARLFRGTVIHSSSRTELQVLRNAVLGVSAGGQI